MTHGIKVRFTMGRALALLFLAFAACSRYNPPAVAPAHAAPSDAMAVYVPLVGRYFPARYVGVFVPLTDARKWNGEVDSFVALTGKQHGMYLVSSGFGCLWADQVADFIRYLDYIHAQGATSLITWMPMDCSNGGFGNVNSLGLPDILSGAWDVYMIKWATDIAALGYPVFVRWGHEMNIPSYSWGAQYAFGTIGRTFYAAVAEDCGLTRCYSDGDPNLYDGPERYVAAYRHVHDLVAPIAPNIVWIWNPNARNWPLPEVASWNQYNNYYPGDAYVDWVALDGYNWGAKSGNGYGQWLSFDGMFGTELNDLQQRYPAKLQMIAEFASVEDDDPLRKPAFIRDAYRAASRYANLRVIVWVQDNTFYDPLRDPPGPADFRVNSSSLSLQAYQETITTWSSEAPLP